MSSIGILLFSPYFWITAMVSLSIFDPDAYPHNKPDKALFLMG